MQNDSEVTSHCLVRMYCKNGRRNSRSICVVMHTCTCRSELLHINFFLPKNAPDDKTFLNLH